MGKEMKGTIAYLPGGRHRVLSGGTRNELKLSRPWQLRLEDLVKPEKCPFCTKPQEELDLPKGSPAGWKLLPNPATPHPGPHALVVPDQCWSADELQRWGGAEALRAALYVASNYAFYAFGGEIEFLVNVGVQAGQNLGHPHMHVFEVLPEKAILPIELLGGSSERVRVFDADRMVVAAGGVRAGECYIIPQDDISLMRNDDVEVLASTISRLIDLGNERFRSKEGLSPAYGLTIRLDPDGDLRYVGYAPFLHHWGVLEYMTSVLEGAPFVLPWPHEVTAAHLRG